MGSLEVLVTTMHRTDFSIYEELRLTTAAVIANQADCCAEEERVIGGQRVRMVTTDTRGASVNRNIALRHGAAELLLFADDDLVFNEGYEQLIREEFRNHPEAAAIRFQVRAQAAGQPQQRVKRFCRASIWNAMSGGVCGLAVRRDALLQSGIRFRETLGPGTEHFCGEDSVFLKELIDRRLLFLSPKEAGCLKTRESSWFRGYTRQYFESVGYVYGCLYGGQAPLFAARRALLTRKAVEFSTKERYRLLLAGIRSYQEEQKKTN